ncbi:MAG: hypothetical protein JSR54_19080 [Proteobacteria bacterium]|nr:hypothetical protein [Pseudomonadota bacterium]
MPNERGTLEEVLGVERQIAGELAAARQQAGDWLDSARREIEAGRQAGLEQLKSAGTADAQALERSSQARAAAIAAQAGEWEARVQGLDDAALRPIVRRALAALVPGGAA